MKYELDHKAKHFLVNAINSKIVELKNSQKENPTDENIIADASNDIMYYDSLIVRLSEG